MPAWPVMRLPASQAEATMRPCGRASEPRRGGRCELAAELSVPSAEPSPRSGAPAPDDGGCGGRPCRSSRRNWAFTASGLAAEVDPRANRSSRGGDRPGGVAGSDRRTTRGAGHCRRGYLRALRLLRAPFSSPPPLIGHRRAGSETAGRDGVRGRGPQGALRKPRYSASKSAFPAHKPTSRYKNSALGQPL
jgi:hypothetical protein